jgi:hypothetical protein
MGGASPAWSQQVVVVVTVHSTSPFAPNRPIVQTRFWKNGNNNTIQQQPQSSEPKWEVSVHLARTPVVSEIWKTPNFSPNKSLIPVTSQIMPTSVAMLCCGPSVNTTNLDDKGQLFSLKNILYFKLNFQWWILLKIHYLFHLRSKN